MSRKSNIEKKDREGTKMPTNTKVFDVSSEPENQSSKEPKMNKTKVYKLLTIAGTIILAGIIIAIPALESPEPTKNKELDKISKPKAQNLKIVSDVVGPTFQENWNPSPKSQKSQASQTTAAKEQELLNIVPIPIEGKEAKLEFLKYRDVTKRIINTASPKTTDGELSSPPLNVKNVFFSNNKNNPKYQPLIKIGENNKIEITINPINQPPPPKETKVIVDKLFNVTDSIRDKTLKVEMFVKAEKFENKSAQLKQPAQPAQPPTIKKEENTSIDKSPKLPSIKLRLITEKGTQNWLNISQEISPTNKKGGEWVKIEGNVKIKADAELINLRAECNEHYSLSFMPEIKVSLAK
jgi:hypothetical protein